MLGFIKRVRELLDRTKREGKRRWLCVRVPCFLDQYDKLGLHLPDMVAAGVDLVNVSSHYFTNQDTDLSEIVALIPGTPVYLEMCHTTITGSRVAKGYDAHTFRRTTPEQYYTTAHLAYSRGAAGISAFNFVYYREHGRGDRGPFHEPPFYVFEHLGDPVWLAQERQHYFLAKSWNSRQLPRTFSEGEKAVFHLDMAPPAGGWQNDGILRIQSEEAMDSCEWSAAIKGVPLKPTQDLAEPFNTPYTPMLGSPETMNGWIVPTAMLQDGINNLHISLMKGDDAKLVFLDVSLK
jgi:hypothetical protein